MCRRLLQGLKLIGRCKKPSEHCKKRNLVLNTFRSGIALHSGMHMHGPANG